MFGWLGSLRNNGTEVAAVAAVEPDLATRLLNDKIAASRDTVDRLRATIERVSSVGGSVDGLVAQLNQLQEFLATV